MDRKFLSKKDLLNWMNAQLAKNEDCNDCMFSSVLELREKDENGCNWNKANLSCSGVPVKGCKPIADEIVKDAKTKFNVKQSEET
jgi:hypothetical protein